MQDEEAQGNPITQRGLIFPQFGYTTLICQTLSPFIKTSSLTNYSGVLLIHSNETQCRLLDSENKQVSQKGGEKTINGGYE